MRKAFIALLASLGVAAFAANVLAEEFNNSELMLLNAKSAKDKARHSVGTGVTFAGSDPETVWVGHVFTGATYDYGPFHIGRGPNRPLQAGLPPNNNTITPASAGNGAWQFDLYQPGENDSLQGWWPIKLPQRGTVGILNPPYQVTDRNRTWWALDHGNQLNYRSTALKGGVPRTFGVAGLWHSDNGSLSQPLGAAASPKWLPIGGSGASAWCGLRALGDNSFVDTTPGVGNPFNGSLIQYNRQAGPAAGNWTALPGYTEQIDQMLFRDFVPTGLGHTLNFDYVTRMSLQVSSDPTIIHGWFNFDPLRQPNTTNDGNYISATDAAGGGVAVPPVDSFMVYIGAPVNDAACTFSDGSVGVVYDPLRRWFSEVLDITKPMTVILHVAGEQGGFNATTGVLTPVNTGALDIQSAINAVTGAGSATVRLVFRIKTNRVGDDTDGAYDSQTAGAAILDNVVVGGTGGFSENFDAGGINNTAAPTSAFHSTGKPPYCQAHIHNLSTLVYNELCGPPNSTGRACDIWNNIISLGDHQNAEAAAGLFGGPEQEQVNGVVSPTINLLNGGVGVYNGMGIDEEIASRAELNFWYDAYAGRNNIIATGNAWSFAGMAYPVKQPASRGATKTWGPLNQPGFIFFNPDPQCFFDIEEMYSQGCMAWDNTASVSTAHPDSVAIFIGNNNQCWRFTVQAGCGSTLGFYLDQMSIGFNNTPVLAANSRSGGTNSVGAASVSIWQFINDTFPTNATTGFPGTVAFDTCAAMVKTGLSVAPATGANRPVVPGDSTAIIAAGTGMRLDMVFRIKPGPGNYVTAGTVASGLRQVPSSPTAVVSGDNSFWGQYEASNGAKGSANTHAAHAGGWDPDCWNSARMDTVERNFFPARAAVVVLVPNNYMTMYHDDDPHGGLNGGGPGVPGPLAKPRNKCFLINPAGSNNSNNITCGNGTYPPAWTGLAGSGYDGNTVTYEYTKILPDGIFAAGTHVEYFFRKEEISSGNTFLVPDTNTVSPQGFEGSTDGHRWQEFSVLPDMWKQTRFNGQGGLCMLFVDNNDRRGNERIWVSVADSIGATVPAKWGAHNGWHAVGGSINTTGPGINDPANNRRPDGSVGFRSDHGGQPGSIWDMYGIKASESLTTRAGGLGARLGAPGFGYLVGHESTIAPTPEMLQTYYDFILWVTGDLNSGILGPYANQTTNDVLQAEDYMLSGTTLRPRAVWVIGNGFAEGEGSGDHAPLVTNYFGMSYRGSYGVLSGTQLVDCVDVLPTSPVSTTDIYSGNNICDHSNDVVNRNTDASLAASAYSFYQALGGGAPYIEGLRTDLTASKHYKTAWDGLEIEHIYSRFCLGSFGRLTYIRQVLVNVIGTICPLAGSPVGIGDDGHGLSGRDFLTLASANPYRNGTAKFSFGIARSGKVEVGIFDVAGRQVRVLANQVFQPGKYELTWDGLDAGGNAVSRGVYFYRLKSPNFTSANKMIVLK